MNFDFTAEQKQFAESVRRFAREHLAEGALKRAHDPRFPFDVAQLMAKQGLMGITLPRKRRRAGRHADGRRDRHRAGRRRMPAQRRRGAVRQFRSDPHLCRIRHAGAKGALARRTARRPHGDEPRHDRTRCRLGADRSQDQRAGRRRALRHQRQQGVLDFQSRRADFSRLCALRSWRLAASARC